MKKISLDTYILLWIILIISAIFVLFSAIYSKNLLDQAETIYENNRGLKITPHEQYAELKIADWVKDNSEAERLECIRIFIKGVVWNTVKKVFLIILVISCISVIFLKPTYEEEFIYNE